MSVLPGPEPDLVFIAETITVQGGSVLVTRPATSEAEVERMVWLDGTVRETHTQRPRTVRLCFDRADAVRVAVSIIQAAATPNYGGQP